MADTGDAMRAAASSKVASTLIVTVVGRGSSADDDYKPTRGQGCRVKTRWWAATVMGIGGGVFRYRSTYAMTIREDEAERRAQRV